jgi:hypothetical protein
VFRPSIRLHAAASGVNRRVRERTEGSTRGRRSAPGSCRPCAHEHNQIDWLLPEDVLSLQFADPGYCNWIAEALESGDAVVGRQPDKE